MVCGGGTGLVTAIRAAQLGLKVILLEKAARVGGNTDYAHGFFPIYTVLHRPHGVEDVREQAIVDLCARTGNSISEEIMRTCVYGCGEFFDWLYQFPGADKAFNITLFGERRAIGPIYGPAVVGFPKRLDENLLSRDPSFGPGWAGTWIKNTMLKAIPAQKLNVEILTKHAARHLITDETGRVTGVIADDPGGQTKITAKAVVLATGGMDRSDEKLQKYFGFFDVERPVSRFSVPSDTGDAIDMLQELGVEPDPEQMHISLFGPAHHPFNYSLYRLLDHPSTLAVTLNGTRFFDESTGLHGAYPAIKCGPKQVMWGIYTQKNIDDIMDEYLHDPTLSEEYDCYKDYQKDLDTEAAYKKPPVMKADSLEKLAEKIGIPEIVLCASVAEYNEFCIRGEDSRYGKAACHLRPRNGEEGPWYGVFGQMFSECSAGGVQVNGKCQVLRDDGTPFPGSMPAATPQGLCTGEINWPWYRSLPGRWLPRTAVRWRPTWL